MKKISLILVLSILAVLAIGWILVLVEFGRNHTNFVRNVEPVESDDYSLLFLSFWVFSVGVPAVAVLSVIHTLLGSKNGILKVFLLAAEGATATALGGCMFASVFEIHLARQVNTFGIINSFPSYAVTGLIGELLSFISLIALLSVVPYIIENYATDSPVNQSVPYANMQGRQDQNATEAPPRYVGTASYPANLQQYSAGVVSAVPEK